MTRARSAFNLFVLAGSMAVFGTSGAATYHLVPLAMPPGISNAVGFGLNNLGDVAGYATNVANVAVYWDGATHAMHFLPDLSPGNAGDTSIGWAINDSGAIVGFSGIDSGGTVAALWSGGSVVSLGDLPGGPVLGNASGINSSGAISGSGTVGGVPAFGYRYHAFATTTAGGLVDLGDLPRGFSNSQGNAINEAGKIVGFGSVQLKFGATHAYLWSSAGGMQDLGDLPGGVNQSEANAINNLDQVVGRANSADGQRAFIWSAGTGMQDLGTLAGAIDFEATGINDSGQVVGVMNFGSTTASFVWESGTGLVNLFDLIDPADPLKSLLAPYLYAVGINAQGQILVVAHAAGSSNQLPLLLVP